MPEINNPKIKNKNQQFGYLPLRADDVSANKYLEEENLGNLVNYISTQNNFSNDYGQLYNYYISGETIETYWGNTGITYDWKTEFGYYPIISTITYE